MSDRMILEGLVTTLDPEGTPNLAPMGPLVNRQQTQLTLRPFRSSTTYRNLTSHGEGVLHVIDDVELLARCAIDCLETLPPLLPAQQVRGAIVASACRWLEFSVVAHEEDELRATMECHIRGIGRGTDFFGFNRAKHAVVEAAILATRVNLLPREQIISQFAHLAIAVEKTAGEQERRAFELLANYVGYGPHVAKR